MFNAKKFGVEFSPSKVKFLYTSGKNQIIDRADCEIAEEFGAEEALRNYVSRVNPKAAKIKASVNSPQTVVRFWNLPPMSKRDVDKAVRLNLEHVFPIDMSGYTMSYKPLSYAPETRVMAAALPTGMARGIAEIFKRNNLSLDSIDIYQNCIVKYFASMNELDAGLFYQVAGRIYFILIKNGIPEFIRDFDGRNCEIGDFFLKNGVNFKKAYFIEESGKPLFPAGFEVPAVIYVERLSDGFEGLQGLLI